jgi:hypothetical protein
VPGNEKHPSFSAIRFSAKNQICYWRGGWNFIQKYFLQWGEHHDLETPNWKPFQILDGAVGVGI